MNISFPKMKMTEEAKTKKGLHFVVEILVFVAVFFVAEIVAAIPNVIASVAWMFRADSPIWDVIADFNATGDFNAYLDGIQALSLQMPEWFELVSLFCTALATGTVLLFCRVIQKRKLSSLGLRRGNVLREYLTGALVGIVMISLTAGLCVLFGGIELSVAPTFSVPLILTFLGGYLLQGMSEEVLCRGYLMTSVSRRYSMVLAVVTNSVIFGLLHFANPGFGLMPLLNIALFGAFESVYVLKRGNLWGACAIHSLWNFFQGNIFGISVSGTGIGTDSTVLNATVKDGADIITGGTFGVEGGICVTIVTVIALLVAIFVMKPKKSEIAEPDTACDAAEG